MAELMLAWQRGDGDGAWDEVSRLLFPRLCMFFRPLHGDDTEDLAQETIVRIWKARNFDPRQNSDCDHPFSAWVSTIAHRLSHDRWERDTRRLEKTAAAGAQGNRITPASPDELLVAGEHRHGVATLVQRCLAELSRPHQQVLNLQMQELSNRDIATVLGIPSGTAGSRLFRAHERFTEALARRRCYLLPSGSPCPRTADVLGNFRKGTLVHVPPEGTA